VSETASAPVELLLSRLKRVRRSGRQWTASCPVHEDRSPSMWVTEGDDGRALFGCRAGCDNSAIVDKVGLAWPDLFAQSTPRSSGPFVPRRVDRRSDGRAPLTRQQIEDDHDAGLLSNDAYMAELISWNLALPHPAVYPTREFEVLRQK
jgi:hypothetical protein